MEMKKVYSLKRNEEIAKIIHLKKMVINDVFVIYFSSNNERHGRVCISVSKKNGIAVVRNRIKRQIREMVTDIFDFSLKYDYVIVAKRNFLNNDFTKNHEKLNELYLKLISKLRSDL